MFCVLIVGAFETYNVRPLITRVAAPSHGAFFARETEIGC
jgi:hypothetical protein